VGFAFDYLYSLGHQRIAFIGNLEHGGIKERLISFQHHLRDRGLSGTDDYVQQCANSRAAALSCTQYLLSLSQPPTAIFCATDLAAFGAISGVLRQGWKVPENVSIIGFDDIEGAADTCPALTTVRQPIGEMASRAVSLLMRFVEGEPVQEAENQVIVQPKLIVRQSCAPPGSE
jgi:DNA-binding LacI/PurR family transcriptional regulator